MNASLRLEAPVPVLDGTAEHFYFGALDRRLFGWLHRARGAQSAGLGLVICEPFGYEAICSHRSLRLLAESAAAAGVPTLRFDYVGSGDSADLPPDVDQLEAWVKDIIAAVAELQARTGVDRVCLAGLRLGATLATRAARECAAVDALVLIAPVVTGRRYLRDLRLAQLAVPLSLEAPGAARGDRAEADTGSVEFSGFPLYAASRATLGTIDLAASRTAPAAHVLILDEASRPAARSWADALAALGVDTRYLSVAGLFNLTMIPPHLSEVPKAMLEATLDWLQHLRVTKPARSIVHRLAVAPGTAPAGADDTLVLGDALAPAGSAAPWGSATPPCGGIIERTLDVQAGVRLFGIVTEPAAGACKRAVILLNTGANHHVGGSRMHVSLARHWAALGFLVVRFDLAGIGDSETPSGAASDDVFTPTALEDIRAVIGLLRERYAIEHVTLGGLCSGAYHALRAAVAGLPVNHIFLVNPVNFFWKKGMTVHEVQLAHVVRNPTVYYERIFSYRALKKLLTGQVAVLQIARVYLNSLLPVESVLRDLARRLHIRLATDLGRDLEELAARGVQIAFVFARGDSGLDLLRLQGGSSVTRLGTRCRVHLIDGADHAFSQRGPRAQLERILTEELTTVP